MARMLAPALDTVWRYTAMLLLIFSAHVRAHPNSTCGADDFSVMYNGRAYFTVSSLHGSVTMTGPLSVGGLASFPVGLAVTDKLNVTGPSVFSSVNTAGAFTSSGGVTVAGGSLLVNSGVAQFNSGAIFQNAAPSFTSGIAGPVTFSGATTHVGPVTASSATLSSLSVAGASSFAAITAINKTVSGAGSFGGGVTVSGNMQIAGTISNAYQFFQRGPAAWQNNIAANSQIQNIAGETCVTFTCPKAQCMVMMSSSGHFNRDVPTGQGCWIIVTHTIDNIAAVGTGQPFVLGTNNYGSYQGSAHTYADTVPIWMPFSLHQTASVTQGSHTQCLRAIAQTCSGNWYFNGMAMYTTVLQL